MGLFDKTSQYKENYEKDLQRVYDETYNKAMQWRDSMHIPLDELLEDKDIPLATKDIIRESVPFWKKVPEIVGTSVTLVYISLIHTILFTDEYRMGEEMTVLYDKLGRPILSAEEIYESFLTINPDAVEKLLSSLSPCSLSDIDYLKNTYRNKEKEAFTAKLGSLTCDLSILHFFASFIPFIPEAFTVMMNNPTQFGDFLYDSDTNLAKELRKNTDQSKEEYLDQFTHKEHRSAEEALEVIEKGALRTKNGCLAVLGAALTYFQLCRTKITLFDFEEQYYTSIAEDPELKPYIEKWMQDNPMEQFGKQEQPEKNVTVETEVQSDVGLHWPTDEVFLKHITTNKDGDYYSASKFGSSSALRMSIIYKLFIFLVKHGKLESTQNNLMLFAFRLTGKNPHAIETDRKLRWLGPKSDYSLCYLAWYVFTKTLSGRSKAVDSRFWTKTGQFFEYADGNVFDGYTEQSRRQDFSKGRDLIDSFANDLRDIVDELTEEQKSLTE